METVTAGAPARARVMGGAIVVVFLGLAGWGWCASLRRQAPGLELALSGAGLVVVLSVFAATRVSYVADEVGLRRRGVLSTAFLSWQEIGRYHMAPSAGLLTCVLHDLRGRRRMSVSFGLLEENGEALAALLRRKLPELLPDQEHEWPDALYQHAPSAEARRSHAVAPALLASAILLGTAAYLGLSWGPRAWRDEQLLRQGRMADGTVWAVLDDEAHRGAMYDATAEGGAPCRGAVWVRREEYPRYVEDRSVRVRDLPGDPRVNALELVLRERRPRHLAVAIGFMTCLLSGAVMLAWLRRARRRARPQASPGAP